MADLKNCPFCGGRAEVTFSDWTKSDLSIRCVDCDCGTGDVDTDYKDMAIEAWNQRTTKKPEKECKHEWVDADNEVCFGGQMCPKCLTIRTKPENWSAEDILKNEA